MYLCGALVDASGLRELSRKSSSGKHVSYADINDLVCRALRPAEIPAIIEPTSLSRTDGKRPDDLSLIPWNAGKSVL